MADSFYRACILILLGIVALWLALLLLAQIWAWLVLVGSIVILVWLVAIYFRIRRNRW